MCWEAKSGKPPPPEIAALVQQVRASQLQKIAGVISNLAQPMSIHGLSDSDRQVVANLVAQRRMQITN